MPRMPPKRPGQQGKPQGAAALQSGPLDVFNFVAEPPKPDVKKHTIHYRPTTTSFTLGTATSSFSPSSWSYPRLSPPPPRAMELDDLPNDLLLAVFSRLEEGRDLLDGVALVSRRWLSLSREARAWAGVRLAVTQGGRHEELRVVARAPALRCLDLTNVHLDLELPADARTLFVLRGCSAEVRELRGGHTAYRASDMDVLLDVALLQRAHLRAFTVVVGSPGAPNAATPLVRPRTLCATLGQLQRLTRLDVVLFCQPGELGDGGLGTLRTALPRLASLSVYYVSMRGRCTLDASFEEAVALLLLGSAATLRHVLFEKVDLRPNTLRCLARCAGLRTLHRLPVSAELVRAMAGMRRLEELDLTVDNAVLADCDRHPETAAEIVWSVGRCLPVWRGLRLLRLHVMPSYRRLEATDAPFVGLVTALVGAASNVRELDLNLRLRLPTHAFYDQLLDGLLALPRLQFLTLHAWPLSHTWQLREIATLRVLVVSSVLDGHLWPSPCPMCCLRLARRDLETHVSGCRCRCRAAATSPTPMLPPTLTPIPPPTPTPILTAMLTPTQAPSSTPPSPEKLRSLLRPSLRATRKTAWAADEGGCGGVAAVAASATAFRTSMTASPTTTASYEWPRPTGTATERPQGLVARLAAAARLAAVASVPPPPPLPPPLPPCRTLKPVLANLVGR